MGDIAEMLHQLSLERQQALEEAIERAEACEATSEDFDLIRSECGLTKGKYYGFDCERKQW